MTCILDVDADYLDQVCFDNKSFFLNLLNKNVVWLDVLFLCDTFLFWKTIIK